MLSLRLPAALAVVIALGAPAVLPGTVLAATPGAPNIAPIQSSGDIVAKGGSVTFSTEITATPCTPGVNCASWIDIVTQDTVYESDTIDAAAWYAFQGVYVTGPAGGVRVTGGGFGTSVVDVTWTVSASSLKYGINNVCLFAWQGIDNVSTQLFGGVENYRCVQLTLAIGAVVEVAGGVTITHDGLPTTAVVGSLIGPGDTVATSSDGAVKIVFVDNTMLTLAASTKVTIDSYIFDPATAQGAVTYSFWYGVFQYLSGLIGHDSGVNIQTSVGSLGIRGSEAIFRYDPGTGIEESDLILGTVTLTPLYAPASSTFVAPTTIRFNEFGVLSADPLTQATYDLEKQAILSLLNQPPVADAGGPYSGAEGSPVSVSGTAADPDGDAVTRAWTYSVVSADAGASCSFADPAALVTTVTCSDDGTFKLTLTADDGVNAPVASDATLTVSNAAPVVSVGAPLSGALFAVGTMVSLTAPFTDAGTLDAHSCTIDWGNGSGPQPATMTETVGSGAGTCSGSLAYAAAGFYTVSVSVADDAGSAGAASVAVVVYNPSAGSVTGSGWINSPAGAYPAAPAWTGKAAFGFSSKYLKGATAPTGTAQFQLQAAGLAFYSASYQWLVVTAGGSNAQLKGTGTINGAGAYGFMLWAGAGSPNTFRIRITTSGGALVYDNGVKQPLGGGSIVIHAE